MGLLRRMERPKKNDKRLYTNTTACCYRSRPRISYGYPVLRTLISFPLFLNSVYRSDEWLFMLFLLFLFRFSFRLFKRKISLWATCTTTNEYAEETPTHGAFFHLEIPSVIISGASRAREEEQNKNWRRRGGEVVFLHDFFYFSFLFFSFYVLGLMCCDNMDLLQSEFFEKLGTSRWRIF